MSFRLHAVCTNYPTPFCQYVNLVCEGAIVTYQRGTEGIQLCFQISAVPYSEVGKSHLFTIIDPFGKHMCTYQPGVVEMPAARWGQKHVHIIILAKADQFMDIPCDGQIVRVRQGGTIVTACIQTAGWQFGELLRQYMVRTERHCALLTYALPVSDDVVYHRDEL